MTESRPHRPLDIDSRIDAVLRYALAIGTALVLLLPGARGFSDTVGWLPLWLLVMPAMALWALRGFPLPRRSEGEQVSMRRRRIGPQARRRSRPSSLPISLISRPVRTQAYRGAA
ncbi:hypothetical protein [Lysobacter terrae]